MQLRLGDWAPPAPGEEDFFPTPPGVTRTLFELEPPPEGCRLIEPCAGGGAIIQVAQDMGWRDWWANELRRDDAEHLVRAGIVPERYVTCSNWLSVWRFYKVMVQALGGVWGIVTNPPFSLLPEFALCCHRLGLDYVALLMPYSKAYGEPRRMLNETFRDTCQINLSSRPFPKQLRECSWFIRRRGDPPLNIHYTWR